MLTSPSGLCGNTCTLEGVLFVRINDMADKGFKTIEEQLEILRSRRLTINDELAAKDFLHHNNYYRISGYSLTLRKNDVFSEFATFKILLKSTISTMSLDTLFFSIWK